MAQHSAGSDRAYQCPVEVTLDILEGKWTPIILAHLKDGAHRYGQLRRRMPTTSEKVLTQRLRALEAADLVERRVGAGVPAPVEYDLTDEGRTLEPVLQALYAWGQGRAERFGLSVLNPGTADTD